MAEKAKKKIRLVEIAYARSGDKGDLCNIGLMAHDAAKYEILKKVVTPEKVKAHFGEWVKGPVKIFPMDNIYALEILLYNGLGGGATNTLRIDQTGKGMGQALLRMEVEI
ncbi:MAG TPA: hypothetical protein VEH58_06755 [Dehalococcoidales bacterium]|nr:hypothetical protein [Dehalococcoidales bacterium]